MFVRVGVGTLRRTRCRRVHSDSLGLTTRSDIGCRVHSRERRFILMRLGMVWFILGRVRSLGRTSGSLGFAWVHSDTPSGRRV